MKTTLVQRIKNIFNFKSFDNFTDIAVKQRNTSLISDEITGLDNNTLYTNIITMYNNILKSRQKILEYAKAKKYVVDSPLSLYDTMMAEDTEINKCVNLRQQVIINTSYEFYCISELPIMEDMLNYIKKVFYEIIPDFNLKLKSILDAMVKGYSIHEIMYEQIGNYITPVNLLHRNPENFNFDNDGNLRYLTTQNSINGEIVEKEKFLVYTYDQKYEMPFGNSILDLKNFNLFHMKRVIMEYMIYYIQKCAIPFTDVTHKAAISQEEKRAMELYISNLKGETGIIHPEYWEIKFLDNANKGEYKVFIDCLTWINNQINSNILGQTLETGQNIGTGSYAQSKSQAKVRDDIRKQDCIMLESCLNNWIKYLIDINFQVEIDKYPFIRFDIEEEKDLKQRSEILTNLYNIGMPISIKQIREEFGLVDDNMDVLIKKESLNPTTQQLETQFDKYQKDYYQFSENEISNDIENDVKKKQSSLTEQ